MNRSAILLAALLLARAAFSQTPADQLTVAPGFKVELLKAANAEREGSWVSMTTDDKGRLYISPQGMTPEGGIMRLTLDDSGHIAKTDWLKLKVGGSMGMLWAFNSLYVNGQGSDGQGIYRLRDTDADGELDKAELFKKIPNGGGEHGSHAMVLGPDGKSIYIVNGNSTPLIDGIDTTSSPYRNYGEDILVPRVMDPVATFFDNLKTPYGHILRTDENGTKWELMAGGMRNAYDIDFNADGELFTYDSDMEWDVGMPWYRPSRVLHLVPGGEYGFREGNQKWPVSYADSLPPVCDIGLGCPTGVKFGTKSNFPAKYKSAFFILDWTFGRILAVHMQPRGASYTAKCDLANYLYPKGPEANGDVEVFLSGKAMPLSDVEFGKDGSMYFIVGGRGTQAGLYRVSYTGKDNVEPISVFPRDREGVQMLFNGLPAIQTSYGSAEGLRLKFSEDPKIRAAQQKGFAEVSANAEVSAENDRMETFHSRLALESMDPGIWKSAVLSATKPAALTYLLALARVGTKADQPALLLALKNFPIDKLDEEQRLIKLRVIKVCFARMGRPSPEIVQMATEKLMAHYPASNFTFNRELSELLVWLTNPALETPVIPIKPGATVPAVFDKTPAPKEATEVIARTLRLLANAPTQEEQIWYAAMLREAAGWTPEQRAEYFAWFNQAREYKGGNSLGKFIERIKEQALAHVPDTDRAALAVVLNAQPLPPKPQPPAPTRAFQKAWTLADLDPELPRTAKGRNFARGKEIFSSTQCFQCHHFGQDGGNVGPDITAVGNRFSRHDILEAIIDPSKAISEQYAAFLISTKAGETIMGQVVADDGTKLTVLTDPIAGRKQDVAKADILTKTISPVSLMPPGLINTLTPDEVLDLLAYIESGGHLEATQFAK
jgi:putative heme-binding domain-containing protein